MAYTIADFSLAPKKEKKRSLLEIVQDTATTRISFGNLAELIRQKKEQQDSDKRAHRAVGTVMSLLAGHDAEEEEEEDGASSVLKKVVRFMGKQIVKRIVRPIISFATRVAL